MADNMADVTKDVEFNDPFDAFEWRTEGVHPAGAAEAIIYRDEGSGTYCRILRLPPGFKGGTEPLCHEFDEVVFIVSGGLVNQRLGQIYEAGTVAVFPAGTKHGPLAAPVGAVNLEFRHYRQPGS